MSGRCQRCGSAIRYAGQSMAENHRALWQDRDGSLHCPGLPFGDDWHLPFGQSTNGADR